VAELIDNLYTLVRLAHVDHGEILHELDMNVGRISEVASIAPLHDGSWEMLVLKSYLPILQEKLSNMYHESTLDLAYDPSKPTRDEVEYLGLDVAKDLNEYWFRERARTIIEDSWSIATIYYTFQLECKTRNESG
jgi:hypothetical protein